jgi:hypothetical protein
MRLVTRSVVCLVGALSLGLFACGGGGDDDGGDDDGGDTIDPTGTNNTFVISALDLPENGSEATMLGLDIDGKAMDGVDNQLGSVLGAIGGLAPDLALQESLDGQVDQGQIVVLANIKAKDLANSTGVGLYVLIGNEPTMPAACTDATDMVCRKHLAGTGTFTISADSPPDASLAGRIVGGKFTGGPGRVTLQIALAGGEPIDLPLQKARAEISGITTNGFMSGKIGGAIAQTDIDAGVIPAIGETVRTSLTDSGCMATGNPTATPPCGCMMGSTGAQLIGLFDTMPKNCEVSDMEVDALVSQFLTPDIDLDGNGTNDAISLGIGVTAVKGTFPAP